MNKTAITMMLSLFLTISPLVVPLAHASAPTDNLQTFLADNSSNSTVQSIQQLLSLKQKLEQGKKDEVLAQVAQQAVSRALAQTGVAADPAAITGTVTDALQNVVRNEITKQISSKIEPYQTGLQALAQLFGQTKLQPEAAVANNSLTGAPENYSKILDITATAYGPGIADNGHWGDNDYFGNPLKPGDIAVDPSVIPMGTKLWIPGYGYGVANDQGSAIKGNRIDLFFPSRQAALDYGIQNVKVYVLK